MSYRIETGTSWNGSMPSGSIPDVQGSKDLKDIVPGLFPQYNTLSPVSKVTAAEKYPSYKNAIKDKEERARDFDFTIGRIETAKQSIEAYEGTPQADHDDDMWVEYGKRSSMHGTYEQKRRDEASLDNKADKVCRAEINQRRHEDAIIKARDANGGTMPDDYNKPLNEWGWFNKK